MNNQNGNEEKPKRRMKHEMSSKNTHYRFIAIDDIKINKEERHVKINKEEFVIKGWAFDKEANAPASDVYLTINGKDYKCRYGIEKKALAERFNNPSLLNIGFAKKFNIALFGPGLHTINIKVISADGNLAYKLPERPIVIEI